jgi:hypothetical protein
VTYRRSPISCLRSSIALNTSYFLARLAGRDLSGETPLQSFVSELFDRIFLVGGQILLHDARPFDARRVHARNCKRRRTDHT